MRQVVFEEVHELGGQRFYKRLNYETGEAELSVDGRTLSLAEWNRFVNQHFPMRLKSGHSNPVVRWKEQSRIRSLARLLTEEKPAVAADIGCEAGHISAHILPHAGRLCCVDSDPGILVEARRRLSSDRVKTIASDVTSIALSNGACDAVLAASILEHVLELDQAVLELKRIVRPGGRLVISVPNDLAILRIKRVLRRFGLGRMLGPLARGLAMGHVQIFTHRRLRELAARAGSVLRSGYLRPFCLDIYAVIRI